MSAFLCAVHTTYILTTKKRLLILSMYSLQNVTWHFNPTVAPHMGGLWEAGVKSFKTHLYKQTAGGQYTFEESYRKLRPV